MSKKTIIITGASSGIGAEIAIQYASCSAGARLFLLGRNKERLETLSLKLEKLGAEANFAAIDVTDKEQIKTYIEQIGINHGIDIMILSAGISAGTSGAVEEQMQIDSIFNTNFHGVINCIMPAIPYMKKAKSGNIAIISSMAGMVGLSSAPAYSASKGAIRLFAQAIEPLLRKENIMLSTIIPGFVKTPMTDQNSFPMPMMMDVSKAARIIIKGINRNQRIIAFPLMTYMVMKILQILPACLVSWINSKLPGKKPFNIN